MASASAMDGSTSIAGENTSPSSAHDVIEFMDSSDDHDHAVDGLYGTAVGGDDDDEVRGNNGGEEQQEDEEVLQLAARLAPAFEEAHHLFHMEFGDKEDLISTSASAQYMGGGEDDDLKREMSDLEHSENLLRQELEQANFFSNFLMRSPGGEDDDEEEEDGDHSSSVADVTEADMNSADYEAPEKDLILPPVNEEELHLRTASSTSKRRFFHRNHSPVPKNSTGETSAPQTPVPDTPSSAATNAPVSPILVMGRQPLSYNLKDHKEYLEVTTDNGWYMTNMNRYILPPRLRPFSEELPGMADFCISCPENRLKTWYLGFAEGGDHNGGWKSPLPVRTSVIHIRPDVLCGAVMDAVVAATTTLLDTEPDKITQQNIIRRQGGHLQLSVTARFGEGDEELQFLVDAQLCTYKSNHCERVLLVRIFHYAKPATHPVADQRRLSSSSRSSPRTPRKTPFDNRDEGDDVPEACLHLREACALVQRIEIKASNLVHHRRQIKFRPAQSASMSDRDVMAAAFGKHLHKTYKACPSTMEGTITLPALNSDDWSLLKASWLWSDAVWDELENRSLTYTSLAYTRFGSFPCLPTLDVHYCSQIRRYSRETMIVQLLKSATQLEEYTRDSEYACANVIALLHKTFKEYGVDPPPLPVAVPLTSYPLDHAAPQAVCPPWGLRVMEALNQVQAWADETGKKTHTFDDTAGEGDSDSLLARVRESTELATRAVAAVLHAFQAQDDEEKGARLQRKNNQVMDRLSFMKKHQIVSVELLDQCTSDAAQKAADDMFAKTKVREVPLLKFGIVARSTTGACIVTARHIFFVMQFLPLLGGMGQKVNVFDLKEVDFELQENAPVILNALPTLITVEKDGEEVFSFRPSAGGPRLKNFLDIMKSIACGSESLLSS